MTPNHQVFTLDQVSEMVKAGLFRLPGVGVVSQDYNLTNDTDLIHTIFLSQISTWTGNGMKVGILSKEKCKDCGLLFREENKFSCSKHERWAKRVFISVSGLKDHKTGREKIYSDRNNIPLSIEAAIRLKDEIVNSIKDKTFNIKRYLPPSRQVFLFENYKQEYLRKMEWRANLPPGESEWMSTGHLKGIKSAFKNHLNFFDDFDIQNIKAKHVQDWIDALEVSRDHKRKLVGYLSHMLKWAKSREDLTVVPAMPTITFVRKKKKGLVSECQLEILEKIPRYNQPIFKFLIETGRRLNEARAIRVKDIDFKRTVYRIGGAFDVENYKPFPKVLDHAEEEFPITTDLIEIVKDALNGRVYGPDSYLFINKEDNHYTDRRLRKIFDRARKKAGYETQVTLNVFGRHSMGYQLKMAGASDEEISSILGNTAKIVHETYTHVEAGGKVKILNLLDKRKESGKSNFVPNMSLGRKVAN